MFRPRLGLAGRLLNGRIGRLPTGRGKVCRIIPFGEGKRVDSDLAPILGFIPRMVLIPVAPALDTRNYLAARERPSVVWPLTAASLALSPRDAC